MATIPTFTASASIYRGTKLYRGVESDVSFSSGVIPAIPPCRNCDYICDVCLDTGQGCGACARCAVQDCDPCPGGGCRPPLPDPFE